MQKIHYIVKNWFYLATFHPIQDQQKQRTIRVLYGDVDVSNKTLSLESNFKSAFRRNLKIIPSFHENNMELCNMNTGETRREYNARLTKRHFNRDAYKEIISCRIESSKVKV